MRRLVFLLMMGCCFFSCKKEYSYEGGPVHNPPPVDPPTDPRDPSNIYYIRASIDGRPITSFTFGPTAQFTTDGQGNNAFILQSYSSADVNNLNGFTFTIYYTTVPITVKEYREDYVGGPSGFDYYITGLYNPNSTTTAYTAGYGFLSTDPLRIVINTITSTEVTGLFSGNLYRSDVINGQVGMIYPDPIYIEGFFYLPVQ